MSNKFAINKVTYSDLNSISELHISSFSNLHLTKFLPKSVLINYYSLFLSNDFNFKKLTIDSIVHGFILTGKTSHINRALNEFKRINFLRIFLLFFIKPKLFLKVVFKSLTVHDLSEYENDFVILSVVSSKKFKGIGKYLVESSINDKVENCDLYLYVNTEEVPTINFYLDNGFIIKKKVNNEYIMKYIV